MKKGLYSVKRKKKTKEKKGGKQRSNEEKKKKWGKNRLRVVAEML